MQPHIDKSLFLIIFWHLYNSWPIKSHISLEAERSKQLHICLFFEDFFKTVEICQNGQVNFICFWKIFQDATFFARGKELHKKWNHLKFLSTGSDLQYFKFWNLFQVFWKICKLFFCTNMIRIKLITVPAGYDDRCTSFREHFNHSFP